MFAVAHSFGKSASETCWVPSACLGAALRTHRFWAFSCIGTMAIDSPCPAGRQTDIARQGSATKGRDPTAVTRHPRSDLVKLGRLTYASVNNR